MLKKSIKESKKYWENILLNNFQENLFDIKGITKTENCSSASITINKDISERIIKVGKNNEMLIFTLLFSGIRLHVNRLLKNTALLQIPSLSDNPSMNVLLPINTKLNSGWKVKDLIRDSQKHISNSYKYQFYPIDKLLKELGIDKSSFEVGQLNIMMSGLHSDSLIAVILKKYVNNVNLIFTLKGEDIHLKAFFNENIYEKEFIDSFLNNIEFQISQAMKNLEDYIHDLELCEKEEIDKIIKEFNDTKKSYNKNLTIKDRFEEIVRKFPHNIAVSSNGEDISYATLNKKANKLARFIMKKRLSFDETIAIWSDKSIDLIIQVMAILKCGYSYLPVDQKYPKERMKYVLSNSRVSLLLTNTSEKQCDVLSSLDITTLNTKEMENEIEKEYEGNLTTKVCSSSPAYIIYTSGSTGMPKGVSISNQSVIKVATDKNIIDSKDKARFLQVGSMSFDASILSVFIPLLNGANLFIENDELILNFTRLKKYIQKNEINLSVVPTILFNKLTKNCPEVFEHFSSVLVGGDVIDSEGIKKVYDCNPNLRIINGYGPTENTVISTKFTLSNNENNRKLIPIGKPVSNSTAYVMNDEGKILPCGFSGELYVGGDGLALGYHFNDTLTKEKFVVNRYNPTEKLYKTGDLAKLGLDGNLYFLGRKDFQVKIRGFRIEIGEIEKVIEEIEGIKECIVVSKKGKSEDYLSAYLLSEKTITKKKIVEYLSTLLPEYMIPDTYNFLDEIPTTVNGKVNRKYLIALKDQITGNREYEAPKNIIEKDLHEIWKTVLNQKTIGTTENFFSIGGHSLSAINIISRINKQFEVDFNISDLFKHPTIKELGLFLRDRQKCNNVRDKVKKNYKVEKKEFYATTPVQKRLYTLFENNPNSINYNIPNFYVLKKDINRQKLKKSLFDLVKRHESLRTIYSIRNNDIVQNIQNSNSLKIEEKIIKANLEDSKDRIDEYISNFIRPFDLNRDLLFRSTILELQDCYILGIDIHHIAADAVSMKIILSDLNKIYNNQMLAPIEFCFKDYASYFNQEKIVPDELKTYWKKRMKGELPLLNIPTTYKRENQNKSDGNNVEMKLSKSMTSKVKKHIEKYMVTNYMFYLTIFNILLSKYCDQDDIIIGSPTQGREREFSREIVGCFVNTLPIRNNPKSNYRYSEFLNKVKNNIIKDFEHQKIDFYNIVDLLNVKSVKGRSLMFDIMFSVEYIDGQELKIGNYRTRRYKYNYNICKFDITCDILINPNNNDTFININYNKELYSRDYIMCLIDNFINIIKTILINKDIKIDEIPAISKKQQFLIDTKYNNKIINKNIHNTLDRIFEKQVDLHPNTIAVRHRNQKLTYKTLNDRANKLANQLIKEGVSQYDIVPIVMDKSIYNIISLLAVLKTGAAFLPIDNNLPSSRINLMIELCKAKYIITLDSLYKKFKNKYKVICADHSVIYEQKYFKLDKNHSSEDLCYIIFTSGTTGLPKGVMIEHRNIINTLDGWFDAYDLENTPPKILQLANFSFDVFIGDVCKSLLTGGELIICEEEIRFDFYKLYKTIDKYKISMIESTPSFLIEFTNFVWDNNLSLKHLHFLILGSDTCNINDFNKINERFGDQMRVINSYGITEAAVDSSYYELENRSFKNVSNLPIGKPMKNTNFLILNSSNQMLPVGVYGELCIVSKSVGRGYLNDNDLTDKKFLKNKDLIMYKTGDIARWIETGDIELIGRKDNQLKIRGHRIETGEIENNISKYPSIIQAVVVPNKNNEALVCFYTSNENLEEELLKKQLEIKFPSYMIPYHFKKVDNIPLTVNNKVDRKQLRAFEFTCEEMYVAPSSLTEKKLESIFSKAFGVQRVSIKDDFFQLGGHSLIAIKIISSVYSNMNIRISIKDIYKYPSIYTMAKYIDENVFENKALEVEKAPIKGYYKASSVQKRLYIIQQTYPHSCVYNLTDVFKIKGQVDIKKTEKIFKYIISRHEALRTTFHVDSGEVYQKVNNNFDFKIIKVRGHNLNNFIRPFNLSQDTLIRVYISSDNYLIIDTHHIISDGPSLNIIMKEFIDMYDGIKLKPINYQYKDYTEWENKALNSNYFKNQKDYWLNELSGRVPFIDLSTDKKRPNQLTFDGDIQILDLSEEVLEGVNNISKNCKINKSAIFMAAYYILLYHYSSQTDIIIGTPSSGRTTEEFDNTIGMFLNTLPIRLNIDKNSSISSMLNYVNNKINLSLENQDYDIGEVIKYIDYKRKTNRNALFDIMFTIQNISNEIYKAKDFRLIPQINKQKIAKFDLSLFIQIIADKKCKIILEYKSSLFREHTVQRMLEKYQCILEDVLCDLNKKVKDINFTKCNFNKRCIEHEKEKETINNLFIKMVEKSKEKSAVSYRNKTINYRTLNEKSNKFSRLLLKNGIKKGQIIPIIMERSIDAVIAVIGVMKIGGIILPIPADYPENRINNIIKESQSSVVIVDDKAEKHNFKSNNIINIERIDYSNYSSENLMEKENIEKNLYAIYTSGTTGKPKGIIQTQKTILNLVEFQRNKRINFNKKVLQFSNFGFDVYFQELFSTLLNGGHLIIAEENVKKNIEELSKFISSYQIEILFLPTAFLKFIFSNAVYCKNFPTTVKEIITSGEALIISNYLRTYIENFKIKLHNQYGPAETHVATAYTIDNNNIPVYPPIGMPIDNLEIKVCDENLEEVPEGIEGELFITGSGLASGYIQNESLNKKKFINLPHDSQKIFYRTGDIVKKLKNGELEYIGRLDRQIKIRGYRVELLEIQKVLLTIKNITNVIVTHVDNNGLIDIYAFYISNKKYEEKYLKMLLSKNLPEYMIPKKIIKVEKFPITINGKVNEKELLENINNNSKITSNKNCSTEKILISIWEKVINTTGVKENDNFFDIGGNSLLLLTMQYELSTAFPSVVINIADLFQNPTIKELKTLIEKQINTEKVIKLANNKFPVEFFETDDTVTDSIKYTLPKEEYRKLLRFNDALQKSIVKVFETLLLIEFSKYSLNKNVGVNIYKDNNIIVSFLDFEDYKNSNNLLSMQKNEEEYILSAYTNFKDNEPNSMCAVIIGYNDYKFLKNKNSDLLEKFNMYLIYESDYKTYHCIFNQLEFSKEKIKVIFKNFIGMLTTLTY